MRSISTYQLWTTPYTDEEKKAIQLSIKVKIATTEFGGWGVGTLPDF